MDQESAHQRIERIEGPSRARRLLSEGGLGRFVMAAALVVSQSAAKGHAREKGDLEVHAKSRGSNPPASVLSDEASRKVRRVGAPLTFEESLGQVDPRARFVARAEGATVFLVPEGAVLASRGGRVYRMRLAGGRSDARLHGQEPSPTKSHYFTGRDPSKWRTGVSHFGAVRYEGVYPGIDVLFHASEGRLEYDFVLAAGADPGLIRLDFEGAVGLRLEANGDLVLGGEGEELRWARPRLHQTFDGEKREVDGGYVLDGENGARFWVAAYDPAQPLVIDPVLSYSTLLGGSADDEAYDLAVDSAGAVWIAGKTDSADFPATSLGQGSVAGTDGFITKFAPGGSPMEYSVYLGGSAEDEILAIGVDVQGRPWATGLTASTDFPSTVSQSLGAGDCSGAPMGFVTRLAQDGSSIEASGCVQGTIAIHDIDARPAFKWTTGEADCDFRTSANAYQRTCKGLSDAFVLALNEDLSAYHATFLGGGQGTSLTGGDVGYGIAGVPSSPSIAYVAGKTAHADFPVTPGAFQTVHAGAQDAFVTYYCPFCVGQLQYSTFLGGSADDAAMGVVLDAARNAYVAGYTASTDFPLHNPIQPTHGGGWDLFVSKLNTTGSAPAYSTFLGGSGDEQFNLAAPEKAGQVIALDALGQACVAGSSTSSDYPVASPLYGFKGGLLGDAVISQIAADGLSLVLSGYVGSPAGDNATAAGVDGAGLIYAAGFTDALAGQFPLTFDAFQPQPAGARDAFWLQVAPLSVCKSPVLTVDELDAEVELLSTSSATKSTLHYILGRVQQALNNGRNDRARTFLGNFDGEVIKRTNYLVTDPGNPDLIILHEGNRLICGAANVIHTIPLP